MKIDRAKVFGVRGFGVNDNDIIRCDHLPDDFDWYNTNLDDLLLEEEVNQAYDNDHLVFCDCGCGKQILPTDIIDWL